MKTLTKTCLVLLAAVAMTAFTANAQTDSSSTSTNKPAATAKPRAKRYAGKITSVEADAKTITFSMPSGTTHTIKVTSKTKIVKDGQAATFADATVGEHISGTYHVDDSENSIATTVRIGAPKPRPAPSTDAPPQ